MPRINLRQLRDTRKVKQLLDAGDAIELCERNRVIARITPEKEGQETKWPDFAARLKQMWGDRVFNNQETLDEIREDRF